VAGKDGGDQQREARQVIARLADELLPVLIARLEASGLGELEVREGDWRVRLRRPHSNGAGPAAAGPQASAGTVPLPSEPRQSVARLEREREREVVTSPAVGYFTPRDDLKVGVVLGGGDVIGHIDVLGVRQEVIVPEAGTLARLEVETGQAVEYGQPIARVEPEARG
jgi:acetyl-CoA carboxylase biotin carboxyl carrier protein